MLWKKEKSGENGCCNTPSGSGGINVAEACRDGACEVAAAHADTAQRPVSGTVGLKVDLITVKALLNADALRRLDGRVYRFCPEPRCDVVYFGSTAGSIFRKGDLNVRVGQKEKEDPIPICYCFGITVADIRREITTRGKTSIPSMITAEVKAGHCACEVKNPQGSCCLGDVSKAVRRIQTEISKGARGVAASIDIGENEKLRNDRGRDRALTQVGPDTVALDPLTQADRTHHG